MSRRRMKEIGVSKVQKILGDTGLSRKELFELTGESVVAINLWASRGKIPVDMIDTLKIIANERSETRSLQNEDGTFLNAEMVEVSRERLKEISQKDSKPVRILKAKQMSLKEVPEKILVKELERRGWLVSLTLKGEEI